MSDEISHTEIKEILGYIESIKNYDNRYYLHLNNILSLIWAFMFFAGGIMDFLLQMAGSVYASVSWIVVNIGGIYFSIYISRYSKQYAVTEQVKESYNAEERAYIIVLIFLITIWIAIIGIMFIVDFERYILASISFSLGLLFIFFSKDHFSKPFNRNIIKNSPGIFLAIITILTSIVIIINVTINGEAGIPYSSLIFGIMNGLAFFKLAFTSND